MFVPSSETNISPETLVNYQEWRQVITQKLLYIITTTVKAFNHTPDYFVKSKVFQTHLAHMDDLKQLIQDRMQRFKVSLPMTLQEHNEQHSGCLQSVMFKSND
jgi:hypothetical protein